MKTKTKLIRKNMELCIVSHCYRDKDNVIRIISARKATKNEAKTYNRYLGGGIQ